MYMQRLYYFVKPVLIIDLTNLKFDMYVGSPIQLKFGSPRVFISGASFKLSDRNESRVQQKSKQGGEYIYNNNNINYDGKSIKAVY